MAIKKVWIDEGCIVCCVCEDICPEVFKLIDHATVIDGVNYSNYEMGIKETAEYCPNYIIKYSE